MNKINKTVYKWVEEKVGDKVDLEIEQSIENRTKVDIDRFVRKLVDEDFNDKEINKLKAKLLSERDFEPHFSIDDLTSPAHGEGDGSALDLSALCLQEEPTGSSTEVAIKRLLQVFEYMSPDEVICQASWTATRKAIQDTILKSNQINAALIGLKILRKLITYTSAPKSVCEGFATLSENVILQIEGINSRANRVEAEELYDIQGGKAVRRSSHRRRLDPPAEKDAVEILARSIYMLLVAQNGMPGGWLRFSERKLTEIISIFIHLLAVSFSMEKRNISALDVVAVLQPRAMWCRNWCHGSLGRGLLCQELRKNRRLFHAIVETVITGIPAAKKLDSVPSSANDKDGVAEELTSIPGIPIESVLNSRFCHCFSMVTYIIQWRAGRALFPLQTAIRRRPWTAQDLVGLMVEYVMHVDTNKKAYKPYYIHHMIDLGRQLMAVETEISSARGFHRRSFR